MTDDKLNNADPEDISELFPLIEQSFGFKFDPTDLKDTNTFGELCDIVLSKVQHLDNFDDYTTQQAFYKLRDCFSTILHIEKFSISTDTQLPELLRGQLRWRTVKKIERQLGLKLSVLHLSYYISIPLLLICLSCFIGLFFVW